jgi:hypothetical protein
MRHQFRDPSWMEWRKENPEKVLEIRQKLRALFQKSSPPLGGNRRMG